VKKQIKVLVQIALLLGFLFVVSTVNGQATDASPPPPDDQATDVYISMVILNIDQIDGVKQSFDANVYLKIRWNDPRLKSKRSEVVSYDLNKIWYPKLAIVNQRRAFESFPDIVEVTPEGEVTYQQRIWGTFSHPLSLKDFPFDHQTFRLQMAAPGLSPSEVNLIRETGPESEVLIADTLSLPDWSIDHVEVKSNAYQLTSHSQTVPGFALTFSAHRMTGYFVFKMIAPLILIVMMSWIVFWIDPEQASTQISVSVTSMLTLIAYRLSVDGVLPKVSYLTRMDYLILASTVLVFAALIMVVITSVNARNGMINRARMLDRMSRLVFPSVFTALVFATLVF
jgi:hypothetical protein